MPLSALSSRAIIGEFYDRLNQGLGKIWVPKVSREIKSNQETENYKWLGSTPAMREWIGGRQPRGLRDFGVSITNRPYESTLEISVDDLRRDKTDQIMTRIQEQADRANAHWARLLSLLIDAGETGLCYDGKTFFATDHVSGDSGPQSNALSINIVTPAAPTASELQDSILEATQALLAYKDDEGEPMNETALEFMVMVPPSQPSMINTARGPVVDQRAIQEARPTVSLAEPLYLVFLFLTCVSLLIGAEVNEQIYAMRQKRRRDLDVTQVY